ncbi:MAG: hypothetical protein IJR00_03325 [Lachnospiraceae bacterium]|nr:hypothetical protein [Lachnospiraceae bacterium]MBQ6904388.1 hypothetical protein [Lachnospiraceae bacterium]
MSKQDAASYIAMLEQMERDAGTEKTAIAGICAQADRSLSSADTTAFLQLKSLLEGNAGVRLLARSADLMRLRFIIGAVESEQTVGLPLFTGGIRSFSELLERYMKTNLMLRRIEFDLVPGAEEAYAYIRETPVSPYAVSAILYNMISILGHREEVLLKLSQDALSHERYAEALGFLNVVEQPSDETISLKNELTAALTGGGV